MKAKVICGRKPTTGEGKTKIRINSWHVNSGLIVSPTGRRSKLDPHRDANQGPKNPSKRINNSEALAFPIVLPHRQRSWDWKNEVLAQCPEQRHSPMRSWRTSFAVRYDEPGMIAWRYLQQSQRELDSPVAASGFRNR